MYNHLLVGVVPIIAGGILAASGNALAQVQGAWEIGRDGYVPANAFRPGLTDSGEDLFVCSYGKGVGKLLRSHGTCYIPYGGKEIGVRTYRVLIGSNYSWIQLTGAIPRNIVVGAPQADGGENVYICRAANVVGKFIPQHDVCYIPYGGKELSRRSMEVLVAN